MILLFFLKKMDTFWKNYDFTSKIMIIMNFRNYDTLVYGVGIYSIPQQYYYYRRIEKRAGRGKLVLKKAAAGENFSKLCTAGENFQNCATGEKLAKLPAAGEKF